MSKGSKKVPCHFCDHPYTVVLPWYDPKEPDLRRRQCSHCHGIFETEERFTRIVRHPNSQHLESDGL